MRRAVQVIGLVAAFLTGGAASAAPQTSPADRTPAEIVVTGRRAPSRDEARRFVNGISARVDRQLARLGVPVCPKVIGFPQAIATEIETRIRAVAAAVKLPVGKDGCRGTLAIIGVDDGAGLVRALEKGRSPLVYGLSGTELARLRTEQAPAWAWSLIELQNEDGAPGLTPVGALWANLDVRRASYLAPPTQQAIQFAVVVLEWPALAGKTTTQIADYVAMRTFARTRTGSGTGTIGTILSLFDKDMTAPPSLTGIDLAYLRTLYARRAPQYARSQAREIADSVENAGR